MQITMYMHRLMVSDLFIIQLEEVLHTEKPFHAAKSEISECVW